MEKKFNAVKYKNEYNKEHYARLSVLVPLENKSDIEKYWKTKGYKSFNAYINDLIRKDMNENKKDKPDVNIEAINNNQGGTINIG